MPISFGITKHQGAYVESVGIAEKTEVATLRGSDGAIKKVKDFNPTTDFSLKTRGEESALTVGAGSSGITGISAGITMINEVKFDETNTDFPSAEVTGTNYPTASALT